LGFVPEVVSLVFGDEIRASHTNFSHKFQPSTVRPNDNDTTSIECRKITIKKAKDEECKQNKHDPITIASTPRVFRSARIYR
jgi:hypothetical protein